MFRVSEYREGDGVLWVGIRSVWALTLPFRRGRVAAMWLPALPAREAQRIAAQEERMGRTRSTTLRGPIRMTAAVVVVLVSAVGFLLLLFTEDLAATGSSLDSLSTSGSFLQRDPSDTLRGIDRLTWVVGDDRAVIPNDSVAPLGDELVFEISVSPYPPTSFDLTVDLLLTTVAGEPVPDAEINTIWDMSLMYHGPFDTQFTGGGDGTYTAFFDLFMVGPWELNLTVDVPTLQTTKQATLIVYVWPE